MTEKRFEFCDDGLTIYDNIENDHIGFDDDLEDLLNSQYETILMQRKEIKSWIRYVHELEAELRKQGEMI